jgi:hypothetical protein
VQDHLLLFSSGQACLVFFFFFFLLCRMMLSHLSRRCSRQSSSSTYLRAPLHGCERKKGRLAACAKHRVEQKLEKREHTTSRIAHRGSHSHRPLALIKDRTNARTARGRRAPMHHACRSAARSACSPLATGRQPGQKQKLLLLHAPAAASFSPRPLPLPPPPPSVSPPSPCRPPAPLEDWDMHACMHGISL